MIAIQRLSAFIESTGLSYMEFERTINVGNGYIGKQLKRKGAVGSHILERISDKFPELNILWLITGQQKMTTKNKLKIIRKRSHPIAKLRASA